MSRLPGAILAFALAISTGCQADRRTVHLAGDTGGTAPVGAATAVTSSAPASPAQEPDAPHAGCAAVAVMLRNAAISFGDGASAIMSPRDSSIAPDDTATATPGTGCVVEWRNSTADRTPMTDIFALLDRAGWQRRPRLVEADGPGGEALAFSRGGAACVVNGEWDVEDDADSTYVPKPGFTILVTCSRDRPDPR